MSSVVLLAPKVSPWPIVRGLSAVILIDPALLFCSTQDCNLPSREFKHALTMSLIKASELLIVYTS